MLRLSLCMAGVCSGWSQVLEGPVWFITGHSLIHFYVQVGDGFWCGIVAL